MIAEHGKLCIRIEDSAYGGLENVVIATIGRDRAGVRATSDYGTLGS